MVDIRLSTKLQNIRTQIHLKDIVNCGLYLIIHRTTELENSKHLKDIMNYGLYVIIHRTWEVKAIESYVNCGIIFDYKQDL